MARPGPVGGPAGVGLPPKRALPAVVTYAKPTPPVWGGIKKKTYDEKRKRQGLRATRRRRLADAALEDVTMTDVIDDWRALSATREGG